MKDPADNRTAELPLPPADADLSPSNAADNFSLDDDTPLVCSRDQTGDKTCEACQ